ncbi:MAG TPA: DUF2252 domain-containing protein [Miltoncostaea sp.]|nr:DUF2252 domain-containing protein [Miltoncostaea sp.]
MTTTSRDDRRVPIRTRVEHLTLAERVERGKAARAEVPRAAHAELPLGADRPDPIALLERQAVTRVPELVPIRYGRMLVSPFAFYRGAALIMASDLAGTPTTHLRAQLCGDAHLSNFGIFGSPERRMVFDINDFDETLPGPFEWDVKRLAASLEVAGRERGFAAAKRQAIVLNCVRAYREAMAGFAGQTNLDVFYAAFDVEREFARYRSTVSAKLVKRADKSVAKARTRDSMQALDRLTHLEDGVPRITADPPLIVPLRDLLPEERAEEFHQWARARLREYRRTLEIDRRRLLERYEFTDLARKVVGVGSVGTRAWITLFLGRTERDPLFLQLKEAQPSVLEEFAGRSDYRNAAHRVVSGQRLMQAAGDIFLGWFHIAAGLDGAERDFYVRQLRDWKGSAEIEVMVPAGMDLYAQMCGWTLARAHARSGDPVAIAAYLGRKDVFDRAIATFAVAYADRNEADYALLREAVDGGRLEARTGL